MSSNLKHPEAVWLDFTSGNPDLSFNIAEKLEANGIGFVDAPMSGGTRGKHATLSMMYSGKEEYVDKVLHIIEADGVAIHWLKAGQWPCSESH